MTNLQQGAPRQDPQRLRRLWLGLPIAAGVLVAAGIAGLALVPLLLGLQRDSRRLASLQEQRDQIGLLRGQLEALTAREEKVAQQQRKLFELVSGSGDLVTFISMLDQEAAAAGVKLQLYEPQAPPPPAEGQAQAGNQNQAGRAPNGANQENAAAKESTEPGASLLDVKGLERRSVLMAAQGSFTALLDFLRRVEQSSVLVVQSDLQLNLKQAATTNANRPAGSAVDPVELKMLVSLYGRAEN
jgi:hypothetical protein